jgi:ribosome-binding factor A
MIGEHVERIGEAGGGQRGHGDAALAAGADDGLRSLVVMAVDPAPDGSRLLVTLCPAPGTYDVGALQQRLIDRRGFFRAEVAAAIQRKRTPELAFQIIPRDLEVRP